MANKLFFTVLLALLLSGCYSKRKAIESSLPYSEQINWPQEKFEPANSRFFVHNEIEIEATPMEVWNVLMQAETWPEWYEGAENVKVLTNNSGVLEANSRFTWKTMGLDFESRVVEFEPGKRLSWISEKPSIKGFHAWLIVPTSGGCKLITDESQYGWLTLLEKTFQANKLRRLHDTWLLAIKQRAEKIPSVNL